MKLCKEDLLVNILKSIEGIFDICYASASERMEDFLNDPYSSFRLETRFWDRTKTLMSY